MNIAYFMKTSWTYSMILYLYFTSLYNKLSLMFLVGELGKDEKDVVLLCLPVTG